MFHAFHPRHRYGLTLSPSKSYTYYLTCGGSIRQKRVDTP
jgi:hypothetical protein